jgi:cobalt/nickel transport system permease protein
MRLASAGAAQWSDGDSFVHRLDPRVKLILLLALVISIALFRAPSLLQLGVILLLLITAAFSAALPVWRILRRSLVVVPFVGLFSMFVFLSGDGRHAWYILAKSYLSALSVLVTMSATPFPELIAAARFFRIPCFVLQVSELIYRYLFVLATEAAAMQVAFRARSGGRGARALLASSGMVAVLFARSYSRADRIYRAMQARGFRAESVSTSSFSSPAPNNFAVLAAGLFAITLVHWL